MQGPKINRLIVYLIKPGYENLDQSSEGVALGQPDTFFLEVFGIAIPGRVRDFFGVPLNGSLKLCAATGRGVCFTSIVHHEKSMRFAISPGFRRYLLREERFGLKVILKSVHPCRLRCIDKTMLGLTPKSTREQIRKDGIASDFEVYIEQNLVSSVRGTSRIPELGKTVTGKNSLSASVKVDISNIRAYPQLPGPQPCFERVARIKKELTKELDSPSWNMPCR
jgi:hypothetical protein